jgi:pyruvate-formate lyase-activating enzyme
MITGYNCHEFRLIEAAFSADGLKRYLERAQILAAGSPEAWQGIDFPLEVAVELTNHCNLRCIMCPNPSLKRQKGYMGDHLFEKIIREISEESGFLLMPQGLGESLLHKRFPQMITYASESGIRPIVVLSNGMLLNQDNLSAILDSSDILILTIDGVNAETYESIRIGAKLKRIIDNVQNFIELRGSHKRPSLVLRIIDMKETRNEIEAFKTFWSAKIRKTDIVHVAGYNDWAGQVVAHHGQELFPSDRRRGPCRMLWKNLSVLHDSRVSACCYDAEGELIVGQAGHQTIQEIWNGEPLRKMRELHVNRQFDEIPLCSRCKSWL